MGRVGRADPGSVRLSAVLRSANPYAELRYAICVTNSVRRSRTSGRLRNTRNATGTDPPQNPDRPLIRCLAKPEMLRRARGSGPGGPVASPPRGDHYVEAGPSIADGVAPPVTSRPYGRTARARCDRRADRDADPLPARPGAPGSRRRADAAAARGLARASTARGRCRRRIRARSASTISPTWRRAA